MRGSRFTVATEAIQLPRPPAPALQPHAFTLCQAPFCCPAQAAMQLWLYQQAWAVAQAVARPSIIERDLCGVWN